ncbi:MAG: LysM peptidoglycan-binding domain-containing protein, partial [Byssovorax sp.]
MPLPDARVLPPLLAAILIALTPVHARGAEVVHVVSKGQTLGAIARRYHVPVAALREANGLKTWQQI